VLAGDRGLVRAARDRLLARQAEGREGGLQALVREVRMLREEVRAGARAQPEIL
jgi:hypothetical protein